MSSVSEDPGASSAASYSSDRDTDTSHDGEFYGRSGRVVKELSENAVAFETTDAVIGRICVTSRDLPSGTVVLTNSPLAAVLDDAHLLTHCNGCLSVCESLTVCQRCKRAAFCGPCSRDAYKTEVHADECPCLTVLFSGEFDTTAGTRFLRLIVRLLHKRGRASRTPGDVPSRSVSPDQGLLDDPWHDIYQLETHDMNVPAGVLEKMTVTANQARALVGSLGRCSLDETVNLLCALYCNSHEVISPATNSEYGVGIFLSAAMFNHSCQPNCHFFYTAHGNLCIRTTQPLPAGEELTISYMDVYATREARRQSLEKSFFFTCGCGRCVDDPLTAYQDSVIGGLLCSRRACRGSQERLANQCLRCSKCGTTTLIDPSSTHYYRECQPVTPKDVLSSLSTVTALYGSVLTSQTPGALLRSAHLLSKQVAQLLTRGVATQSDTTAVVSLLSGTLGALSKMSHPLHGVCCSIYKSGLQLASAQNDDYAAIHFAVWVVLCYQAVFGSAGPTSRLAQRRCQNLALGALPCTPAVCTASTKRVLCDNIALCDFENPVMLMVVGQGYYAIAQHTRRIVRQGHGSSLTAVVDNAYRAATRVFATCLGPEHHFVAGVRLWYDDA